MRCTLSPQPDAAAVLTFETLMSNDGWFGYSVKSEATEVVVVGQSTTRACNTY